VRRARLADAAAIGRVQVKSWRTAYHGLLPDELLHKLSIESFAERRRNFILSTRSTGRRSMWVIERDPIHPQVVGVVAHGPTRDAFVDRRRIGEIYILYLDPLVWGQGMGRALMAHSLKRLRSDGFDEVTLWALRRNERAAHFYRSAGFYHDGAVQIEPFEGAQLEEVRFRRRL